MSRPYQPPPTLHEDFRAMQNWIHLERPSQRLRFTLDRIHQDVLKEGLKYLRELLKDAIAKDITLHQRWRTQISPWDERQQGFAYAGWSWHPPPPHCIDMLDREALMTFLIMDVTVHDQIMDSIRRWEKEIRPRDDLWHFDYIDEVWRNEDGEEMQQAWG